MNGTVKEWIRKGEGDFAVARRERLVRKSPNLDAICFHAQQGVEKWMKAVLIHLREIPPKTHDLVVLSELLSKTCPMWSWPIDQLRLVSRAAVTYRYPGETATRKEAREILRLAERIRRALKALFKPLA
jgi:HEPN domain-containing protein